MDSLGEWSQSFQRKAWLVETPEAWRKKISIRSPIFRAAQGAVMLPE